MEPLRTLTLKQVQAMRVGQFGKLTTKVHQLAETALTEMVLVNDAKDQARRIYERLQEYTELRPEHERVLLMLTRPLGATGLPAIEMYSDVRVKLKVAFEDDELPFIWDKFKYDTRPEIQCIPTWLHEYIEKF